MRWTPWNTTGTGETSGIASTTRRRSPSSAIGPRSSWSGRRRMTEGSPTIIGRVVASVRADDRLVGEAGRYVVVGVIGYSVQIGSFALLVHALGVGYLAAAIIAGLLALLCNFLLNRHWTFDAAGAGVGRQAAWYLGISAVFFA